MHALIPVLTRLRDQAAALAPAFAPLVVYNPLEYAFAVHSAYVERFARTGQMVLVGMNPGPFGMAQTGVPFGDVSMVRDFLQLEGPVHPPRVQHPKRPVLGFACPKAEVSGSRLWGWARDRYGDARRFFSRFFVLNYCPLVFMGPTGANVPLNKLPAHPANALFAVCDAALRDAVAVMRPAAVVGVGAFAGARVRAALEGTVPVVGRILHPSPASPAANRGWAAQAESQLRDLGIAL